MARGSPATPGCWWPGRSHPEYRQVLATYTRHLGIQVEELEYDRRSGALAPFSASEGLAAVVVQSPNFFGVVEDLERAGEIARSAGALLVAGDRRTRLFRSAAPRPPLPTSWPWRFRAWASVQYGGPTLG